MIKFVLTINNFMRGVLSMRKILKRSLLLLVVVCITAGLIVPCEITHASITPNVTANVHVQNIGWLGWKSGDTILGTTGQGLRAEALKIKITGDSNLGVSYCVHVQNIGWMSWVSDGQLAGTTGSGLRVEAFKVKLTGSDAKNYDIFYRAHVQNYGWLDWAKNGQSAGTAGLALRIEAMQIKIVAKDSNAPGNTATTFISKSKVGFTNITNSSISIDRAKKVNDTLNYLPYCTRYGFELLGFTIDIGYYNEGWAGLFSSSRKKIYIKADTKMNIQETTLHELGHFIDLSCYNSSTSIEFKKIYGEEKYNIQPMYSGNYSYFVNSNLEYYAECFAQYCYNRNLLKSTCPKTLGKINRDVNGLGIAYYKNFSKIFNGSL